MGRIQPSKQDDEHWRLLRGNVVTFMKHAAQRYAGRPGLLLDIAPQIHEGARPFFPPQIVVETLDVDPNSGCTYIADICQHNPELPEDHFDFVVCTEVLEHTRQPFAAVQEIFRVLKPGGKLFLSVPFNFRIHGPLPDCWRFTEHGLRIMLHRFLILELTAMETADRPLMPIHYTVVAEKPQLPGTRS